MDWQTFVSIVAVPAVLGAYWLAWGARQKAEDGETRAIAKAAEVERRALAKAADAEARLSSFMIEVAQRYASVAYLKDVESRLLQSLAKVESSVEKLDAKIDRLLDRGGE